MSYVFELMHDGVTHGFEHHEGEVHIDPAGRDFYTFSGEGDEDRLWYDMPEEIAFIEKTNMNLVDWVNNYTGKRPLDPRTGDYTTRLWTNPRWGR